MISRKALSASALIAALTLVPAMSSFGTATTPGQEAQIPFANRGGIRDWEADGVKGLWVQDVHGQWYYAKLMNQCIGLNFATTIAFNTSGSGTFDRFSSIVVPREGRCVVTSVTASGPPPNHKQKAQESITAEPQPKS